MSEKLRQLCEVIKTHEGWILPSSDFPHGSRSYRNNSPGNLKFTSYTAELGATGKDDAGFCIFPDYETGFNALGHLICDAAKGLLRAYRHHAYTSGRKSVSLTDFFIVFAPSSDKNRPLEYAKNVALSLQVSPDILLEDII